ncbi:MAG: hypothetical protein VYA34_01520 [Myxococcota bacterium]|nr:hypothetical protein [Myxococcota bacterium]
MDTNIALQNNEYFLHRKSIAKHMYVVPNSQTRKPNLKWISLRNGEFEVDEKSRVTMPVELLPLSKDFILLRKDLFY